MTLLVLPEPRLGNWLWSAVHALILTAISLLAGKVYQMLQRKSAVYTVQSFL